MFVEQVIDKKSYGIRHYAEMLLAATKSLNFEGRVADYSGVGNNSDIRIFHYGNSTRKVLFPLIFSKGKNAVIVHDVVPRAGFLQPFSFIAFLLMKKRVDLFIVHSEYAKKLLIDKYPFLHSKKIIVLPIPSNKVLVSQKYKNFLRKKHGYSQSDFIVAILGGISKRRGQRAIIPQLLDLDKRKVRIIVVGHCSDGWLVQEFAKIPNLYYYGFVDTEKLIDLCSLSDCALIYRTNSVGESSGVVALANSMGVPVIAPRIGSFPEDVQSGFLMSLNKFSLKRAVKNIMLKKPKRAITMSPQIFLKKVLYEIQ